MSTTIDPDKMRRLVIPAAPPFMADPTRKCAAVDDPDVFFGERRDQLETAVRICTGCPLQQQCAAWALEHGQVYGVWGATTPNERRSTILQRRQAAA